MGYSCGHKPYAGVCCVECRPDLFFNAAGFPTAYSPAPTLTPYAPDPRDARIAELEAEAARLRESEPLTYRGQRDAALAEVARLEALIVHTIEAATGIDADLHAEYDRIRARP